MFPNLTGKTHHLHLIMKSIPLIVWDFLGFSEFGDVRILSPKYLRYPQVTLGDLAEAWVLEASMDYVVSGLRSKRLDVGRP